MRSKLIVVLFYCLSALFVGSAQAAPVTWTLESVIVENSSGGSGIEYSSLTGSFVYDADTNLYSDILIQSEPGAYFDGTSYTEDAYTSWKPSAIESPSSIGVILNTSSTLSCPDYCDNVLTLEFAAALTNAGGNVGLSGHEEVVFQSLGKGSERGIVSGSVSAVPVPAAVWLFGSALAGLGWIRRKPTV